MMGNTSLKTDLRPLYPIFHEGGELLEELQSCTVASIYLHILTKPVMERFFVCYGGTLGMGPARQRVSVQSSTTGSVIVDVRSNGGSGSAGGRDAGEEAGCPVGQAKSRKHKKNQASREAAREAMASVEKYLGIIAKRQVQVLKREQDKANDDVEQRRRRKASGKRKEEKSISKYVSMFDNLIGSRDDVDGSEVEQGRVNAMHSHLFGMMEEEHMEEAKKKHVDAATHIPGVCGDPAGSQSGTVLRTGSESQEGAGDELLDRSVA